MNQEGVRPIRWYISVEASFQTQIIINTVSMMSAATVQYVHQFSFTSFKVLTLHGIIHPHLTNVFEFLVPMITYKCGEILCTIDMNDFRKTEMIRCRFQFITSSTKTQMLYKYIYAP